MQYLTSLLKANALLTCVSVFGCPACLAQDGNDPSPPVAVRKNPNGLPNVPSVDSMIHPSDSVERFLTRTSSVSAFDRTAQWGANRSRTNDGKSGEQIEWNESLAAWTPPEFYTRPLYFEQINFERYQSKAPEWTRPAVSYAQFLGTIPVLPYKMGANGPRDRIYTVGHSADGPTPQRHFDWGKLSKRGLLFQGAASTGLVFLIP